MIKAAGGTNRFNHVRSPIPVSRQGIERMNRDTIYSSAIVYIGDGATLTLPDAGSRYLSVAVIDENNFTTEIFHDAGVYALSVEKHGSPFIAVVGRVLVDPTKPADMEIAHQLQDQMRVDAASTSTYTRPDYDRESHQVTHKLLQGLGESMTDAARCNGKQEEVSETRHMVAAAFGWGGLPEYEVVYVNDTTPRPVGHYQMILKNVPVDGFWSISIYNREGYFEQNQFESYSINDVFADQEEDGSVTINFGGCELGLKNALHIMEGWSYVARLYRPRPEILKGEFQFPQPILQ